MKNAKNVTAKILFFLLLLLAAAAAAGCAAAGKMPGERRVKVVFANDEGIESQSERFVEAAPGSDVSFSYSVKEGYTVTRLSGAEYSDDGTLKVRGVRYPTTVILKTRKLERCLINVTPVGDGKGPGGDVGSAASDISECWEGEKVTLSAISSKRYAFAGFSSGKPLTEGGKLLSEENPFEYVPVDSTPVYANFRLDTAIIHLENSPGLIKRTSDTVSVQVGGTVFFYFDLEEGYVVDSVPDGTTLAGNSITLNRVTDDTSLSIATHQLPKYAIQVDWLRDGGEVTLDPQKNYGWEGDTVTLTAEPAPHHIFTGFSERASLESGGKLLSADPEYTFTLDRDMYLRANFELKKYTVTLKEAEGMKILSDRTLSVPAGDDAVFRVELDSDHGINGVSGGAEYAEGVITLKNVTEDAELSAEVFELSALRFGYAANNEKWGSVAASIPEGFYRRGTEITLTATDLKGSFAYWSVGGYAVSYSRSYTFTLSDDVTVTATFNPPPDPALTVTVPSGKWVLIYHPNGGINTKTNNEDYRTEYAKADTIYHCPNSLPDMGQFTREGYVLIGYNTKPDGTGTYVGPGWNVLMPERGAISLYCMWIEETPASEFSYDVSTKEVELTYYKNYKIKTKTVTVRSYNGNASTVVIPERIKGYPVTEISTAMISSKSSLETLVIPRYVQTVKAQAVISCQNLKTVYLPDSITSFADNWVTGSNSFERVFLRATRMPTYSNGRNGTYAVKYDWMMTAPGRKLIIVSGSNSAYGIDSPLLEQKLSAGGYAFSVVNYGQNAGTPAAFYIEVATNFMNPGDVLLVAPELNKYQFGYNEINTTLWQIFEGAYDAFSQVDIRHYIKMFSSFAAFNKAAVARTPQTYETFTSDTVNAWGDYSLNKVGATSSWKTTLDGYDNNGGYSSTTYNTSTSCINKRNSYSDSGRTLYYPDEINRVYDMAAAKGATVLISFPTIVRTCLTKASQQKNGTEQQNLINAVDQYLHGTRISEPWRYIFERQYSYNSNYHLNTAGQQLRTGYIADDLLAYFRSH